MEFSIHTLIRKDLWDAAQWRDTAFLYTPDHEGQPGIGLMFDDYQAGLKLFDDLRAQLGVADRNEFLLVTIVEGTHPTKGEGYAVLFSVDPSGLPVGDGITPSYIAVGSRWRFRDTKGQNSSLEAFKAGYAKHGMYFLTPLDAKNPKPDVTNSVGKTKIHFRSFSDILPDDFDAVVLAP